MSDEHAPELGPVMAFTAKRAEVVRFYTEIAGLKAMRKAARRGSRPTTRRSSCTIPTSGRPSRTCAAQRGFVVWFGIDDVATAFARAKAAGCAVGEFHGDYFFARDPDGRYVGFHANEEHGHGHDHDH